MRAVEFTALGQPITQGSKTASIRGRRIKIGGRVAVIEPRAVIIDQANMSTKTMKGHRLEDWRGLVAMAAREAMKVDPAWPGPIRLDLEFVLARPESHYTKVGKVLTKSAPRHHVTKPDKSKLGRAVEDALSGVVYKDDSQIIAGEVTKRYATRGGYPGVIVKVRRL